MNIYKKTARHLALAAAMLGSMAVSTGASALPAPVIDPDGVYVNPNGLGQALIFPYYTVRQGQSSLFNITNTGATTIAIKVRFREQFNSRDALDFVVVLSPFDVWTGWIKEAADGSGPVVRTRDNSCVVGGPNIQAADGGTPLLTDAFTNNIVDVNFNAADQGIQDIDRAREGYVEVIAMGEAINEGVPVARAARHRTNGFPVDCDVVTLAFASTVDVESPPLPPFSDPQNGVLGNGNPTAYRQFRGLQDGNNPLKGNFSLIDKDNGKGSGIAAVALADFTAIRTLFGNNLITAQAFPYNLEPSLASSGGIWNVFGLPDVEAALMSGGIVNEWGHDDQDGMKTDWVVTFPTKRYHVDHKDDLGETYLCDNESEDGPCYVNLLFVPWRNPDSQIAGKGQNIYAGVSPWRLGSAFMIGNIFPDNLTNNGAPIQIDMIGYNREEAWVQDLDNTAPSPAINLGSRLIGEVNVISFAPAGQLTALDAKYNVVNFDVEAALDIAFPLQAGKNQNGWADIAFNSAGCFIRFPLLNPLNVPVYTDFYSRLGCTQFPSDMPAVGFLFKTRNQAEEGKNFDQIMSHGWYNVWRWIRTDIVEVNPGN